MIWGILLLTVLGFLFGLILAIVAKFFKVEVDQRVTQIIENLPGINCGACGFPGCAGYADAIVNKNADINLCVPGAGEVIEKIGKIMGKTAQGKLKMVAKVYCLGDDAVSQKDYTFNGEDDCYSVYSFYQGEKSCKYGCVGKGNCMRVCPVDAIKRDDLNRIWIDENICIGCEKCLTVCPTRVIHMVPIDGGHFVACSSHDKGAFVKAVCKKGCFGCKICERLVDDPTRIYVDNNLAIVKYEKKNDIRNAAVKCPANVIAPIVNQKVFMVENKDRAEKKNNQTQI
ncbi:MAG TPA: RnfABCDGE type electron transport complex subunit B [Spirochaetota bacterium]|nr:RnfABCDGE type electron transport complex subunit B [Spirochaetota bacterium]